MVNDIFDVFGPLLAVVSFSALWLIASFAVRDYARNRGLDPAPFFIASLFFSPLIGWILAALAAGHDRAR